jgi:hypothetical protein
VLAQAQFRRGDSNEDRSVDVTDSVVTLGRLFLGAEGAACQDAMDSDDNGVVELTDAVFALNFLFLGGEAIPQPFPGCGVDLTEDSLSCESHGGCATPCVTQADVAVAVERTAMGSCILEITETCTFPSLLPGLLPDLSITGTFCPGALAGTCDGEPGCEAVLDSAVGQLDVEGRLLILSFFLETDDMPLLLSGVPTLDAPEGAEFDCVVDMTYTVELAYPLVTEATSDEGVLRVVDIGAVEVSIADVVFVATGAEECALISQNAAEIPDLENPLISVDCGVTSEGAESLDDFLVQGFENGGMGILEDLNLGLVGGLVCQ